MVMFATMEHLFQKEGEKPIFHNILWKAIQIARRKIPIFSYKMGTN